MIALLITGTLFAPPPTRPFHTGHRTPIAGALIRVRQGPGRQVAEAHTGRYGHFTLHLHRGSYRLIVTSDRTNKVCMVPLTVHDDAKVRIVCPVK